MLVRFKAVFLASSMAPFFLVKKPYVASKQITCGLKRKSGKHSRHHVYSSEGKKACKVEKWALLLPPSLLFFHWFGKKKEDSLYILSKLGGM